VSAYPASICRLAHLRNRRWRRLSGLLSLLRPYRLRVAVMITSLVVATGAALAPPYIAGRAIDTGIRSHNLSNLYLLVGALLAAAVCNWLLTALQTYLVSWVGQRALQDLRIRIFSHLQNLSVGFFSQSQTGALISRITNDVEALDQLVTDGVVTLFSSSLMLAGTAAIMALLDPQLALVTFVSFPILAAASLVFRVISANAYRLTREKIALVTAYLQESLSGIRVVKAFAQQERHKQRFRDLNEDNRAANMRTVYLNAAYFPAVELLSAVATVAILLYGGNQVLGGKMTIGILASFVFYLQNFFDPIQQLSQLYTTYQAGMAALDNVFDLLDTQPDLTDSFHAYELPRARGEIIFEDVSFAYPQQDKVAISDLNLTIKGGETVALVGATGAGKSTLAKLVARFYDPTEGVVRVDGCDLQEVTQHSLRSQLGIVPQEGFLFSGTVAENIAFARSDASMNEVVECAKTVGAHEFIQRLPNGYDSPVGERGNALSAGQRQLIAFARALLADPRILILDEATSNVDVTTEAKIEQALRKLLAGRTAMVIAHRLSTVQQAERIIVLSHGQLAEQGSHEELINADGIYARLYRDWAEHATLEQTGGRPS
jgi:ABC-type multidrug transport system fused ATPase/permease subunit